MEKVSINLNRYKNDAARNFRINTGDQVLANDIYLFFGKSKEMPFGLIMGLIKRLGRQRIYEIWNDVRQNKADDHLKLFMWKTKNPA